jgi:adenine-specific DNA-methyltransferase
MATARIAESKQVGFESVGGYAAAQAALNSIAPMNGFLWREYSPASVATCGIERRYFTEENAAKLDAMRAAVDAWEKEGLISELERIVLVADILSATNRSANIAGTYGCFLSKWQSKAKELVQLRPRTFGSATGSVITTVADVFSVQLEETDVAYLDPPYTKRQYASYYHILETITLHDNPLVAGVCGLRPWKDKASPFCYKTKALQALVTLIESLTANRVLLSYRNEGHIKLNELIERLSVSGDVELIPLLSIGRYRPNQTASRNGDAVTEYLVTYKKRTCPPKKIGNL